jgi:2-polyprenyl-3-methyl-5-hydroxy-6-metoxy-1,4-benzoquinol methylase
MNNYKEVIYDKYITNHNRNLYGDTSLEQISKLFPSWRYFYARMLPVNKQAQILDIGCGDGGFVHWLHMQGYENASGIDISTEQIDSGRAMGIRNIFCEDLKTFLERSGNKYELIIARDVLEHFTKAETTSSTAILHMKSHSQLILSTRSH